MKKMKKIIKGKSYDTRTATEVGYYRVNPMSFEEVEETLYRKKTGEYFLHGFGGAMTQYAEQVDQNTRKGGEKIIPMSYEDAKIWAENNLEADEYEKEFGVVEEGESYLTTYIPAGLHKKLKLKQAETGKTVSKIVEEILEKAL